MAIAQAPANVTSSGSGGPRIALVRLRGEGGRVPPRKQRLDRLIVGPWKDGTRTRRRGRNTRRNANQDWRLAGKTRHPPEPGGCRKWVTNVIMEQNSVIQARVLELLGKKVGAARPIGLDSSVVEDTGLDSVSVMDFVMELEDEFDITIPLDHIAEMRTVGDLANTVQTLSHVNAATHGGPTGEGH